MKRLADVREFASVLKAQKSTELIIYIKLLNLKTSARSLSQILMPFHSISPVLPFTRFHRHDKRFFLCVTVLLQKIITEQFFLELVNRQEICGNIDRIFYQKKTFKLPFMFPRTFSSTTFYRQRICDPIKTKPKYPSKRENTNFVASRRNSKGHKRKHL